MRWSSLKLSLLVVLTFSMLLILMSFLFYKNLNILLGFWDKDNRISIYLKADANAADKESVLQLLKNRSELEDIQFIDRTAATNDFKKMFGEYSAGMISVDEMIDLVPESFTAKLKLDTSGDGAFANLKLAVSSHPFVEDISFGGEWLSKFAKLDRALKFIGLTLALVLSLSVTLISALMVRSLVDEAKNEIEVLSLVGATRWLIYRKYLSQVVYFFSLSLVLSTMICFSVFYFFKNEFLVNQGFQIVASSLRFLSVIEVFFVLTALFIFVMTGASFSLRSTLQRLSLFAYE